MTTIGYEEALATARQHAEAGHFADFLKCCRQLGEAFSGDFACQINIGALLSSYGFLTYARDCYERARAIAPTDLRAWANLANLARDAGAQGEARRLFAELLRHLPDHPIIRRNALTSLEYDPDVTDAERLMQAKAWGQWAIDHAGGHRARPTLQPLGSRPLRIGYVSADLCQHTVGLLVKDVLAAHDRSRVEVFVYSAGHVKDWVTGKIRAVSIFRDVSALDDGALARQICADGVDVLIDLSGHTAGSRLTAFTLRPAPVMASWLGYFATTGLSYIDAVFLDEWHAPPGAEAQFVEPVIRLPGRWCFQPGPWAIEVAPGPSQRNGYVTFGSFNNTAKYHPEVFNLWAEILAATPNSRLVLKWRTFNDDVFRQQVTDAFVARGIAAERIDLRGPSFHSGVLREYADLDIALDPFPFSGGMTSCEALWMGVPVITWPQSRVVSRQTHACLHQIGLPELSAVDAADYVHIASDMAGDPHLRSQLRADLRGLMRASPLMDVHGFARTLETNLIELYRRIEGEHLGN